MYNFKNNSITLAKLKPCITECNCVVEGEVLLKFIQEDPSDHVSSEEVLKALDIDGSVPAEESGAAAGKPALVCEEDICKIQK